MKAHPVLVLALLTPGIPEYLSSSSSVAALAVNPGWFFLALALNVGQYTGGALLVREALIRWRKGWPTGIALALAYGITEEGLGDNTLFRSTHGGDGVLGHFGRFLGVNWLWSGGVLTYHVVFSIGLPIVLLALALPETRGRSLIGSRGIVVAFATVAAATIVEAVIVWGAYRFWMGTGLLVGALVAIALLTTVGRLLPAPTPPVPGKREPSPLRMAVVGFFLFPILFAIEYGPSGWPSAAPVAFGIEVVVLAIVTWLLAPLLGDRSGDRLRVAFAGGALVFLAAFGVAATLPWPVTLPLAILAVVFVRRLQRPWGRSPASAAPAA